MIPLCAHPNPERVLIVGGGDGGVAREVVKHPKVKQVYQVEIDGRVVDLSKKYLPFMAAGFDSPKMNLTIGDGFEFMKNHREEFDVIITDSSDPIGLLTHDLIEYSLVSNFCVSSLVSNNFFLGPAVSLFQESYFELMKKALRPGGIVCSQGSSFWIDTKHVKETLDACGQHFKNVNYAVCAIPRYINFCFEFLEKSCIYFEINGIFQLSLRQHWIRSRLLGRNAQIVGANSQVQP